MHATSERGNMSRMNARVFAVALVVAVGGPQAALASTTSAAKKKAPITIYAGPNLATAPVGVSKQADALTFFPSQVTIRVGQSLTWQFHGFHTATFPGATSNPPFIVPQTGSVQPVLNDAAGNPFWWVGKAPRLIIDPSALVGGAGPTISSTLDVRGSGLLRVLSATPTKPAAPYTLKFLKAGVYHYLCTVHQDMRGTVRVLAKAHPANPVAVAKSGDKQLAAVLNELKGLDKQTPPDAHTVLIGAGSQSGAEISSFYPSSLTVNTGDVVTFTHNDPTDIHTVTFGPEPYTLAIENNLFQPEGNPPTPFANPLFVLSSDPPPVSPVPYDGTNHGNGYINSGILFPQLAPTGPHQYLVKFTKPGTYRFECVIHANMDGTIIVR
jgi:plastocyanin